MLAERLLHRVQRVTLRQALDGRDVGTFRLDRQHGAALDGIAVVVDDAGAALAGVAAHMGAGEAKLFTQKLNEQGARLDLTLRRLAVHRHGNGDGHSSISSEEHTSELQSLMRT